MNRPQINYCITFSTVRDEEFALHKEVEKLRASRTHFNLSSWLKEAIAEKLARESAEQK